MGMQFCSIKLQWIQIVMRFGAPASVTKFTQNDLD